MPPLPPATAAVRSAVRDLLTARIEAGALRAGDLVLVACSGGADSLALAAATAFIAPRLELRAGAVSVDHRMQPGSGQVSRRAIDQCAQLGLDPALVRTAAHPPPPGHGPEAAARALRYDLLAGTAERTGAVAVLLGHTLEDQAETVLLGLLRGSGTRSLAGMDPVRGLYLRPLLGVRRAQTEAACAEAGLPVWHDPANSASGPWRTSTGAPLPRAAVREQVLPVLIEALGPAVVAALGRTADLARADADLLDELATEVYQRARDEALRSPPARAPAPGATAQRTTIALSVAALRQQPAALRTRVLHRAAVHAGSPAGALRGTHVRALDDLLVRWRGQGPVHLPGDLRATRQYGNLVLGRPAPAPAPDLELPGTSGPGDDDRSDEPGEVRGRHHHG